MLPLRMDFNALLANSPIDGRYRKSTEPLAAYFSEFALIRYRVMVEIEYFIALCRIPLPQLEGVDDSLFPALRRIYHEFTMENAMRVKEIEKVTNHDVKAVEYFLKEQFDGFGLEEFREFIHFGLTSQDINNTALPRAMKDATSDLIRPLFEELRDKLNGLALQWMEVPMLARTHGQPASPTRLGKEILVFVNRLDQQLQQLDSVPFAAKFGGATGNFNAHHVAYPDVKWQHFADSFVERTLGLHRSKVTTQIEHYDHLAAWCDAMSRLNTILIDLDRDLWTYISLNYFKQKIIKGEVGSSAMPHKVNPIDFENSEGNFGMANAVFRFLAEKLPISRLQRDLTDSTVTRNVGVPVAHTLIGLKSLLRGLDKLLLNREVIENDLNENWAVVAEAIQTVLRRENYPQPYEALKELTRSGESISEDSIRQFITGLDLSPEVKDELLRITPFNYLGISPLDSRI
jgi:adenylosuccinate lyase